MRALISKRPPPSPPSDLYKLLSVFQVLFKRHQLLEVLPDVSIQAEILNLFISTSVSCLVFVIFVFILILFCHETLRISKI